MTNVLEHHDGEQSVHLPNDYTATGGFHTLCGLCDVAHTIEETDLPVDCRACMAVFRHVLELAAERGVISRASELDKRKGLS